MEKAWYRKPLIISALQKDSFENCDKLDKLLDEYITEYSFNTEQLKHVLTGEGGMVYFSEEKDGKNLDEYLKKTRKAGLREIIYYNIHCYDKEVSSEHPEWLLRRKDGSTKINYGEFPMNCMNVEGEWFKHFSKNISDLTHHDIDGIFLDGPIYPDDCCYCETCRKSFLEMFGHDIKNSTAFEMRKFGIAIVTEFIKKTSEIVKSINPDIVFYINNSALRPDTIGSNTRALYDYVDILGAEGGFYVPTMNSDDLWKTSGFAKHLSAIAGNRNEKPLVNFLCHNEGLLRYDHSPAEFRMTYAQSLANGQNVWVGWHESVLDYFDTDLIRQVKEMNEFVVKNISLFEASLTCSRVALVWSQATANYYSSTVAASDFTDERSSQNLEKGDHRKAIFTLIDILERNHIQFDIVDEQNIKDGDLKNYETVIFPEVACMDKETVTSVKEYVYNGGNILGNFDIGMYDENGTFLGESQLGKVFGIVKINKLHASTVHGLSLMINDGQHPMIERMKTKNCPAPLLTFECEIGDTAKEVMSATYPVAARYSKIDFAKTFPVIIENNYGAGKAYYISGNYPETSTDRNISAYNDLIRGYCDMTSHPVVVSDDAGLYELVLRRQDNRFILHIVNMTGAMQRPIQKITPLYDLKIELFTDGFNISDVTKCTTVCGATLQDLQIDKNHISFSVDRLSDYEIVVIE